MRRTFRNLKFGHGRASAYLRNWVLAAALGLFAVACGKDATTAANPDDGTMAGPQHILTDEGGALSCMQDDWNSSFGKGSPPVPSCTTNDINIARTIVTSVDGVEFDAEEDDLLCDPGDPIDLGLTLVLNQTAESPREDVGIWVRNDGGSSGRTGSCNHYAIDPEDDASAGIFNDDGDQCAGIKAQSEAAVDLGEITATCPETGTEIVIGACVAWKVPGIDDVCPSDPAPGDDNSDGYRDQTLPANGAHCTCEPFRITVVLAGTIIIEKQTVPNGAATSFGFTQDVDASGAFSLIDNGTKTFVSVLPNTEEGAPAYYTVTEDDPTPGFDLTNLVCDDANSTESVATRTAQIRVESGETVRCVFTNTARATIIIEKETDPQGATGSFTFVQNVDASGNFNLSDDGSKTFSNVTPGSYTVSENDPTPSFDLTNLVCDDANSTESIATRTATINVEAGETVTCTFTNTQRGSIIIEKETDPQGATGSFTFVQNVDASGNFNLSDDGSKTFSNVVPGGYSVSENDPKPGFDLTNLVCDDANSTESVATRTATINVEAGETVTCTFTNTQRATVQVNKRQSGALPPAGEFEFQIRYGATTLSSGTTIATGTNDAAGVVTFSCNGGDPTKCTNDGSSIAHFVPGDYQLCEVNMEPGWSNNIDGFTPNGEAPEGDDNGNECVDIELGAGDSGVPDVPEGDDPVPDPIDNTPPPGGDARTIGYWKNHSCAAPGNQEDVLSTFLPIQLTDDWLINDCQTVVYLLDKRDISGNHKKMANDAAYGLAAQLAAALLNVNATAATCPVPTTTIDAAQELLADINFDGSGNFLGPKVTGAALTQRNNALSYAAILDDWNNNICPP
jgi:hypothetical protein